MKPILDLCCGSRMFYFDKEDPRVLFNDIRRVKTVLCDGRDFEINPETQYDFRNLLFADNSFSLVVFDPPHLLLNVGKTDFHDIYGTNAKSKPTGYQQIKYGAMPSEHWQDIIADGFKEGFRVLKQGGFLIFKWNETDIKVSEVLALTCEKPIFGHKSGKRSNTHWICFMKGEE